MNYLIIKKIWKVLLVIGIIMNIGMNVTYEVVSASNDKGSWTTKTPMPTAREDLCVGVVNDKLYAIGGFKMPSGELNSVEEYDPETNRWEIKTNMPTGRESFATGVVNGKIYVFGGSDNYGNFIKSVEVYDPFTDKWEIKTPIPTGRSDLVAGVVDNKIYVIGGANSGGYLDVMEIYDIKTDSWTTGPLIPTGRERAACAVYNDKIYVMGGDQRGNIILDNVEVYDPNLNSWDLKKSMPTANRGFCAAVINDNIYTFGGSSGDHNVVFKYNPFIDSWDYDTPMPTQRYDPAVGVINDKAYVVGGWYDFDLTKNEEFTPASTQSQKNDLVGYWNFDEGIGTTVYDYVGNNDGTINGAIWTKGISNNALSFDGDDDYVTLQENFPFNNGPFTMEAWVKPTYKEEEYGELRYPILTSRNWGVGNLIFEINRSNSDLFLSVYTFKNKFWILGDTQIQLDKWYHVAVTYDGSKFTLYQNGIEVASEYGSYDFSDSSYIGIGGTFFDGVWLTSFAGIIDEIMIYNRALSKNEILDNYNQLNSKESAKIKLYIHNLDEDFLDISVYIDGELKGIIKDVPPSRDAIFLTMVELDVEEGSHFIVISYGDSDLGENTDSIEVKVNADEEIRVDLFTMRADKSKSEQFYEHHAQKIENEDIIEHSFIFNPDNVKQLAENEGYADTVAGNIMDDIKDVHGTFYFSDLGVAIGELIAETDIKDDLHNAAPNLQNPDGSYQYGTYKRKISTSQTLKLVISVLEFASVYWRKITSPEIDKALSAICSIGAVCDFVKDRVDEWKYDDDIEIDISKLASESQPLIELATNYKGSTDASLIFNVATDVIEYATRDEVVIKIDGNRLSEADDYDDILNPSDDVEAEYYVNHLDDEYTQIIVSNPNFYNNDIVITRTDYDDVTENEIPSSSTPCFELILLLISLTILYVWRKRKKK